MPWRRGRRAPDSRADELKAQAARAIDLAEESQQQALRALGLLDAATETLRSWVWLALALGPLGFCVGLAVSENVGMAYAISLAVGSALNAMAVRHGFRAVRRFRAQRPAVDGDGLWAANVSTLRNSWLVIAVSALAGLALAIAAGVVGLT